MTAHLRIHRSNGKLISPAAASVAIVINPPYQSSPRHLLPLSPSALTTSEPKYSQQTLLSPQISKCTKMTSRLRIDSLNGSLISPAPTPTPIVLNLPTNLPHITSSRCRRPHSNRAICPSPSHPPTPSYSRFTPLQSASPIPPSKIPPLLKLLNAKNVAQLFA